MRPILSKELYPQDFRNYYWLKEELQTFCRENGMRVSGSKMELTERISVFLQTGEVQSPIQKRTSPSKKVITTNLSLDTIISDNHRCSQAVRAFFQSVIPNFHFSTFIQNYFRENAGKTYSDVVNAWHEEEEQKKDPAYQRQIGSQFEYNQFIRDYFADPTNKHKSRADAIEAWHTIKRLPGSNKYIPGNEQEI